MEIKHGKDKYADNLLVTMRMTPQEKEQIRARADAACQNISDYLRERFFGGRPPLVFTDLRTINELRRLGGLLKNNFDTLRQAKTTAEIFVLQERTCDKSYRLPKRLPWQPINGKENGREGLPGKNLLRVVAI